MYPFFGINGNAVSKFSLQRESHILIIALVVLFFSLTFFGGNDFSSVQFSHSVMSDSWQSHGLKHTRPPGPSPTAGVYSNSCPLGQWCHPTISSSVVPFSSCLQSFSASGSFPVSHFFTSGGQSIGDSASMSVFSNEYSGLISFRWTGCISLLSKGLSRVFSNTTVQKHQSFDIQPSSQSNSHIHTWLLEKP